MLERVLLCDTINRITDMKKIFFLFGALGIIFAGSLGAHAQTTQTVSVYLFYGEGCPHCAKEMAFLNNIRDQYPEVDFRAFEVWYHEANARLMQNVAQRLGANVNGVPFTVIGDWYTVGYLDDATSGAAIQKQLDQALAQGSHQDSPAPSPPQEGVGVEQVSLPLIGSVNVTGLSLPTLTAVFGLADGFNPCAMWTLLFLLGLLLEMKSRARMWMLGGAFIIASGALYFIAMAAWLNVLIFLEFLTWIRILIALVALGAGVWSLQQYFTKPSAVCAVEESGKKQKTFEKLKAITKKDSFWLALGGIVLLAFAVNIVEMMCSIGLPAVYTQVLALSNLSSWQYYGYLALYILFYMLDDIIVFLAAMITFRITTLSGKYSRFSRLIGGVLMLLIGLLLIFKPSWLMFG